MNQVGKMHADHRQKKLVRPERVTDGPVAQVNSATTIDYYILIINSTLGAITSSDELYISTAP